MPQLLSPFGKIPEQYITNHMSSHRISNRSNDASPKIHQKGRYETNKTTLTNPLLRKSTNEADGAEAETPKTLLSIQHSKDRLSKSPLRIPHSIEEADQIFEVVRIKSDEKETIK